MSTTPWWEQHRGRLESELIALDEAGITHEQDSAALAKGVVKLRLHYPLDGSDVELVATYPDMYPYFRPEVVAPKLSLHHHQNPFGKNLCLLGRSTELWHTTDTLASLLREQLAAAVEAGLSHDKEAVAGIEERQAEPYADYFRYEPGTCVIIPGRCIINPNERFGAFVLGLERQGTPALRAALVEVHDDNSNVLWQADEKIRQAYSVSEITGRWTRLNTAPDSGSPVDVFRDCRDGDPSRHKIDSFQAGEARLQIRAALFPQEIAWREADYAWLFACRWEPTESWKARARWRKKKDLRNRGKKRR
jgi:hypothetical protein